MAEKIDWGRLKENVAKENPGAYERRSTESDGPRPRTWMIVGGAVLLLIILAFIVPAFKGYSVYRSLKQQGVPESYVADMGALAQARLAAETQVNQTQAQLASCNGQVSSCNAERQECMETAEGLRSQLDQAMNQEAQCQQQREEQQDIADSVIADAARRLCCIQRIENPDISGYEIVSGKIVCSDDGTPVEC